MNGISNKVSLTEGNIQNIDNENVTVAVSTDVPKELDKVEKDDKQSFEEFKTLYKDVITMKCKQDFGDCEDQKLWEDAAKELFLQSKNYILDGEEFKSKEDLQKEPEKEKKTENVIVTPQVIKENNENEFDDIKPGDEFVNEAGSKIVMLEPTETDEYNFKIINTNTNEEGTGKFSCTFMRDLLKDNHYKKVKSSELSESINNEPKDKLNAIEFVSLIDNLKKMDLWDGKDETFKDAVEKYYSILDTQSKLKNEGTILSEEQLKEEADSPEFKYQLLDRLKSDCEYFLKAGNRAEKHLWAGNVDDQIAKMKELWNSLEEKPEWLSMEDIENYEKEMKQDTVEESAALDKIGNTIKEDENTDIKGQLKQLGIRSIDDIINDLIHKEDTFRYQMLSRLQMDCDYFLGNGNRAEKYLWATNVPDHIKLMRALYNSFEDDKKPEWISMEDIDNYEKEMKQDVKTESSTNDTEFYKNTYSKTFNTWKKYNPQLSDEAIVGIIKALQYNGDLYETPNENKDVKTEIKDKVVEAYDISYHLAEYDKVLRNDNDTYCVKVENRTTQTETKWLLVDKAYVEKMKELENNYKQEESKLNESKLSDEEIQILRKRMTDIVKQYQKLDRKSVV